MLKIVIDTSVYIPFIRKGIYVPQIEREGAVIYMSSVVIQELYAGAFDPKVVKALDKVYRVFTKTGRLIVPTKENWRETGKIMAMMGKRYGFVHLSLARLLGDILISLSAYEVGASVVTRDRRHFSLIQEFKRIRLIVDSEA